MSRLLMVMSAAGAMLVGAQALADEPIHSKPFRQQIVGCMTKRMSANKSLSYIDAAKACKEQLKSQNDKLASGPLAAAPLASVAPLKPVSGP